MKIIVNVFVNKFKIVLMVKYGIQKPAIVNANNKITNVHMVKFGTIIIANVFVNRFKNVPLLKFGIVIFANVNTNKLNLVQILRNGTKIVVNASVSKKTIIVLTVKYGIKINVSVFANRCTVVLKGKMGY